MKIKVFLVLFIMSFVKLFFSCQQQDDLDDCGCSSEEYSLSNLSTKTYYYDDVYVEIEENEEVFKDNFIITNNFDLSSETSASFFNKLNLGYSSAYAFCSCVYSVNNPMTNIIVYRIDKETNEKIEVTSQFDIEIDGSGVSSINELFDKESLDTIYSFVLQLNETETIPVSSIFEVEVQLEDGQVFSNQTELITFVE